VVVVVLTDLTYTEMYMFTLLHPYHKDNVRFETF
jgi:hypothetical protein